jgi:ABC-type nitrate/sulfonate/bicarbonate transport system substrate-binding protein
MSFRPNTPSLHESSLVRVFVLVTCLLSAAKSPGQTLTKVPFPYSPINTSALPFMLAKDAKIFEKYGLDVDLIFMGASALIIQSMLSGAANIAGFGGPAIISNVLRGGDVISVAATVPLAQPLITRNAIEKPDDLRGKKIGISRLGGIPHFALQMILDRYSIKDVTMLQLGTQSEAEIGLRRGIVDGAMVSPPQSFLLIRDGFRELVSAQDYSKFSTKLISGGIAARRSYATKNRDVVVRMIKAVSESIKVMTAQESLAKKTLAKYTRQTQPEILDRLYKFALETFGRDPTMPRDAVVTMARLMAEFGLVDRASAASTPPEAFYDNSYVDEVKQSGFLKELWK